MNTRFARVLLAVALTGVVAWIGAAALSSAGVGQAAATAAESPQTPPAHGGPDAFGYVYDVVPYNWADIAATGTRIAFSTPDDAVRVVNLPQSFALYGLSSSNLYVGTNGYASLRTSTVYLACDPAQRTPPGSLAAFCADLTTASGAVYYQAATFDGHPAFIVQYQDVTHKASGQRVTFQIILDFTDRSITYRYRSAPAGGAGAAMVGIIGSALNVEDYLMACRAAAWCEPSDGLALRFQVPPRPALTLGITSNDPFPDPGASLRYTLTLRNTGDLAAPAAAMTESLPAGLDYAGGLATTAGVAIYDAPSREVRWRGDLAAGARVTVTYAAALNTEAPVYAAAVLTHPLAAAPATALAAPADRWGAPELVATPHFFDDTLASARHLAVDATGAAHIAYGGNGLFYATRAPEGGTWLLETVVPTLTVRPALLLDGGGHPVIAFSADGSLILAQRTATAHVPGTSEVPGTSNATNAAGWRLETIASGAAERIELARGADGRLHLVFERSRSLYYTAETAAGWSAPVLALPSDSCTTWAGFSLALDTTGAPHVVCAYAPYPGNQRELRLFRGGGAAPWANPEVIAANNQSLYYDSPSLAFAAGEFHLAFTRGSSTVLYGRKTGGVWQISQIAQGGTLYDSYVSLDVRGGYVAVAYAFHNMPYPDYPTDIRLARKPLATGSWTIENVESFTPGRDLPYPALALDAAGRGHLAYYYGADETLRYAAQATAAASTGRLEVAATTTKSACADCPQPAEAGFATVAAVFNRRGTPAAFTFETVDRSETLRAAALAVGSDATVHLAYLAGGLRYATHGAGATGWSPQLVLPEANGNWLDLALDAAGAPHAVYARTGGALHHASGPAAAACLATSAPAAAQAWTATIVDQPGAVQSSPAVAVDATAAPHVAYLAAEPAGTAVRHAVLTAGRWQTETLATVGGATGNPPPPEIAAAGPAIHVFYADCTAATTTGSYPIPLRLASRQGAAWQTRTLDTFYGACNDTLDIRLAAGDAGKLVAVAGISSYSMRPTSFQRIFTLSPAGELIAAASFTADPAGSDADIVTAVGSAAPLDLSSSSIAGLVGLRGAGIEYVSYDGPYKFTTYQVTKNGTTYTSSSVLVYRRPGGSMTDFSPIHRNGLGRGGGIAAATETFYGDPAGTGVLYAQITPPRQPAGCQIKTQQEFVSPAPQNIPAPATGATCVVEPAGIIPCDCGRDSKTVSALDKPTCCGACGWNFYEWKGTCTGAAGRSPTVNVACPLAGACDAIAVWHRPLLGVSGAAAQADFCASKQNSDKAALSFELCASSLDDWTVSSLTFQASGNGKDDQEIEKVKLTLDGRTTEGKYTGDDGTAIFAVAVEIKKGQCKSGSLTYTFKQLTCPLCEDPVRKTGCQDAKDFSVSLPAANVTASAKSYPRSLVIGSATGGPLTLQCIKNTNTSKYFYEIQRAVDDGATQNGHTIQVCPGTYHENVNVTKGLTIRSTDGWGMTTVQAAAGNDHVFEVTANNTTIQGFTARGATGANKAGVYLGSASATLSRDASAPTPGLSMTSASVTLSGSPADDAPRRDASEESPAAERDASAPTPGLSMTSASVTLSGSPADDAPRRDASEESPAAERDASAPTPGLDMTEVAAGVKDCEVLFNALQGNRYGVFLDGASKNQIGGTTAADRNVISGNSGDGVRIAGAAATENQLLGNRIGVNAAGAGSAGNGGSGVWIGNGANKNAIGGTDVAPGAGCVNSCNVIANNAADGVTVLAGTGNAIQGNAIYNNTRLGIDLGGDGWTRNGKTGGAAPNNWQSFPLITGIAPVANGMRITGTITSAANTAYRVELYTHSGCAATGQIGGGTYEGLKNVTTDQSGRAVFSVTLPRANVVTATATDPNGNTSEFAQPDVVITGVEISQVTQNLLNEVPLIAKKPTLARVYVAAYGCGVPNITAEIRRGAQRLRPGGNPIMAQTLIEVRPAALERSALNRSLNFQLPLDWRQGGSAWTVEVNPGCTALDAVCGDANIFTVPNVTFQATKQFTVIFVPIRYQGAGLNLPPPPPADYMDYWKKLDLYPLTRSSIHYGRVATPIVFRDNLATDAGWDALLNRLWWYNFWTTDPAPNTYWYGVFPQTVPSGGILGATYLWAREAAGQVGAAGGEITLIHELGHDLGRLHPGCAGNEANRDNNWPVASYGRCQSGTATGDGYWGLDLSAAGWARVVDPSTHTDFMTYRDPRWVSPYTYQGLFAQIRASAAHAEGVMPGDGTLYLGVSGIINRAAGTALFDSMYHTVEPERSYRPGAGPHSLELRNAAGQLLVTHAFDTLNPQQPEDAATAGFAELTPYSADVARVVLKYHGQELATRVRSAHAPTVTLVSPSAGALTGLTTVRWTAGDADGDALRFALQYSRDGGATWTAVATDLEESEVAVDTANLPGGEQCLFRVWASDGLNTGHDVSDAAFAVGRKPPEAVIAAPEEGATLRPAEPLALWGLGSDPEDGPLPDAALTWTDSISGTLGTGSEVELPQGLGRGWHTITLTARDSDGMTGTDSVQVCVGCATIYLPVIVR